jgi:hypothetical protein
LELIVAQAGQKHGLPDDPATRDKIRIGLPDSEKWNGTGSSNESTAAKSLARISES